MKHEKRYATEVSRLLNSFETYLIQQSTADTFARALRGLVFLAASLEKARNEYREMKKSKEEQPKTARGCCDTLKAQASDLFSDNSNVVDLLRVSSSRELLAAPGGKTFVFLWKTLGNTYVH